MTYTADHASAYTDVKAAGTAVTFTRTQIATDQRAASTVSTAGYAIQAAADPKQYEALGLAAHNAVTLLFVPTTYGETPSLSATCSWGGVTYTVRSAVPLAPDGTAILSRVVVAR